MPECNSGQVINLWNQHEVMSLKLSLASAIPIIISIIISSVMLGLLLERGGGRCNKEKSREGEGVNGIAVAVRIA